MGQALEAAAQALLQVARALQGDASPTPGTLTLSPPPGGCTVAEAINDLLTQKARSGRSDRYLRALRNSLGQFARGRRGQPLDKVTALEVEEWLHGQGWSGRTQKGYLGDVATLFAFAQRRGYCAANPTAGVEGGAVAPVEIGIHTPAEVASILELARGHDLNLMRCLAVRYFAGLRASEAEALAEAEIKTDHGVIEVTAGKAKTRRRRLVTIQPALAAWLAVGGTLPLRSVSKRTRAFLAAVKRAGLPWPPNAPRHSFCSYHLAQFESAAKTSLEAGHSEQMLFQHYRALVTRQQAGEFWGIRPALSPDQATTAGDATAGA